MKSQKQIPLEKCVMHIFLLFCYMSKTQEDVQLIIIVICREAQALRQSINRQ